jgi:hypothetical protein
MLHSIPSAAVTEGGHLALLTLLVSGTTRTSPFAPGLSPIWRAEEGSVVRGEGAGGGVRIVNIFSIIQRSFLHGCQQVSHGTR